MSRGDELELDHVAGLSAEQRDGLLAAVRDARREQHATIDEAIDAAMEHVPKLLRGALRKILF